MEERDRARREIKSMPGEKHLILEKYRKLRNRVTTMIKNDRLAENSKRIDEANNENEFWKIVNDISKPNNEPTWKLESENGTITDDAKVAEELNKYQSVGKCIISIARYSCYHSCKVQLSVSYLLLEALSLLLLFPHLSRL